MKFEEVLPALREGKKVRRTSWVSTTHIKAKGDYFLDVSGCLADDWEIVDEPKIPEVPHEISDYDLAMKRVYLVDTLNSLIKCVKYLMEKVK